MPSYSSAKRCNELLPCKAAFTCVTSCKPLWRFIECGGCYGAGMPGLPARSLAMLLRVGAGWADQPALALPAQCSSIRLLVWRMLPRLEAPKTIASTLGKPQT